MRLSLICLLLFPTLVLADVSQDAEGWTVVTPSADSRIVYVSDSSGDDANDGLSQMAPKKTLAAGAALIRDGFPDHLLLKRGDVFTDQWLGVWNDKNGRSATEPSLISTYGTGARPIVRPAEADKAGWRVTQGVSFVAIIGIHFHAHRHDPDDPAFVPGAMNRPGIEMMSYNNDNQDQWLLIEDCKVEIFGGGIGINRAVGDSSFSDLMVRRNVVVDSYSTTTHSQGMFIHGVDGILIEENVFDHNGWYGDRGTGGSVGASATTFNHNIYIDNENPSEVSNTEDQRANIIVRGNIFARASASGIQLRPGGTFEQNLSVRNANIKLGGGNDDNGNTDSHSPDGVDIDARNNVVLEGVDINPTNYLGIGLHICNLRTGVVTDNVIAHDTAGLINTYGVNIGTTLNATPMLDFQRNTLYEWRRGAIKPPGTTPATVAPEENNIYWDAASIPWPVSGTNRNAEDLTFPDPDRSVGSYHGSIGGVATFEAFIAEARQQSKDNWRSEYTAQAVNDYIREGFQGTPPPADVVVPVPAGTTQIRITFE